MNKKYFDTKLFLEGIRQLKLSGLLFFVLCAIGTAFPPIIDMIFFSTVKTAPQIINITPFVTAYMFIGPIVLCMILFSFLNKRNCSDFYHSLPNTRNSIYISFTASILAWIYATIIFCVLLSAALYSLAGCFFNPYFIPYLIFTYIAGVTLITAAILIAKSITGTILMNIIVTTLILFLPRFISTAFVMTINNILKIASINDLGIFVNFHYNIPFNFVISFLGLWNNYYIGISTYTFMGGIIYTFVIALIYLVFAGLLFHFRKSEIADKSTPTPILQHVIRCAVTLPVTMLIPCILFSKIIPLVSISYSSFIPISIVIIAFISLFIYFIFELITSRKAKNLIHAIPYLLVLIIINSIFGVAIIVYRDSILDLQPTANEIQYVSFISPYEANSNDTEKDYNDMQIEKVRCTNATVLSLLSKDLANTIKMVKNNTYDQTTQYHSGTQCQVKMNLKNGKSLERWIYLNESDTAMIENIKATDKQFQMALTSLPPKNSIKSLNLGYLPQSECNIIWQTYKDDFSSANIGYLQQSDCNLIWETYKYEYSHLSGADAYEILSQSGTPDNGMSSARFYTSFIFSLVGNIGINNYCSRYAITPKTTKSMQMIVDYQNEKFSDIRESLNSQTTFNSSYIEGYQYKTPSGGSLTVDFPPSTPNYGTTSQIQIDATKDILSSLIKYKDVKVDVTKPFVAFNINGLTEENETIFIQLPYDDAKKISDYSTELG